MLVKWPARLLSAALCFVFSEPGHAEEFTLAIIPDTQFYTELQPEIFRAQVQWIDENKELKNIIYVAHLGDLKDDISCDNRNVTYLDAQGNLVTRKEWQVVDEMLTILDDTEIPYSVVPGNHDYEPVNGFCPFGDADFTTDNLTNNTLTDDTYNDVVGPARFSGKSYYGDPDVSEPGNRIHDSNEDNFVLFGYGGIDFIAINLSLGYGSTLYDPAINWADRLLKAYPKRLGIITSHYLLNQNPEVGNDYSFCAAPTCDRDCPANIDPNDPSNSVYPPLNDLGDYGGQIAIELFDNPNLFMMLSAHHRGEAWRIEDRSAVGMQPVHVLLQGYQSTNYPNDPNNVDFGNLDGSRCNSGDGGFMRTMRFDIDSGIVDVKTFAPAVPELGRAAELVSDYFPADGSEMDKDTASRFNFSFPTGSVCKPVGTIGYFKASYTDAFSFDRFGQAVSLSSDGNTLAAGAWGEDSLATGINGNQANNAATDSGAVYVFTRCDTGWTEQAYIKASNTQFADVIFPNGFPFPHPPDFRNDRFGWSVSLSDDGNTLAVGAKFEASNATGINGDETDNSEVEAGAAYVFTRTGTEWAQQAYVKPSNTDAGDRFGQAIGLSGDGITLAIGAPGEASSATGIGGNQNDNSAANAGAVYVFTRTGTDWTQQAYVKASNADSNAFGWSVSLSDDGNTLAIGAFSDDSSASGINGNQNDDSAPGAGAVYIFARSGTNWSQQAYIKASNTDAGDRFGQAVSLSGDGNTLAVGAAGEDSSATGIAGNETDNSVSNAGAAYVFSRSGASWTQEAYVKASNTDTLYPYAFDNFGESVDLSSDGNTLAVGAVSEDSGATGINGDETDNSAPAAGAVYVFKRVGTSWIQQDYVKASNTGTGDRFGRDVSLSGNGSILAVGANGEDSISTGIDGNQADNTADLAGAVYLY